MKRFAPVLSVLLLASCAHQFDKTADTGSKVERSIAQSRRLAEEFLNAAFKSSDNALYKSAADMEGALLKEIKANPKLYGLSDEAASKLKRIDDIKNERVMAEILSEAPTILKFTPKMKSAAAGAVMDQAGIASHIRLKSSFDASKITLTATEQTGLGRTVSMRMKHLQTALVKQGIAPADAKKIYDNLFQAAKDLAAKAKGDPAQLLLARQIVDYSTSISELTGKQFLGKGGCVKITGKTVFENKAEIAYRTLGDVESHGLKNYDEISEALQKNQGDVTNRTKKEACQAIEALTVGSACGNVYSPNLKPKGGC